jgi:hypothetical protein
MHSGAERGRNAGCGPGARRIVWCWGCLRHRNVANPKQQSGDTDVGRTPAELAGHRPCPRQALRVPGGFFSGGCCDFRIDLAQYLKAHTDALENLPLGACAVTTTTEAEIPPGIIFCLRAEGDAASRTAEAGYPLAPHFLAHVGDDGTVLLPYTQAKQILDRLKRLCLGRDMPDPGAGARFDKATRQGEDMRAAQRLLATAVASVAGKSEERAVASLFIPGGTHSIKGEFAGINDFEVVAFLIVLPPGETIE